MASNPKNFKYTYIKILKHFNGLNLIKKKSVVTENFYIKHIKSYMSFDKFTIFFQIKIGCDYYKNVYNQIWFLSVLFGRYPNFNRQTEIGSSTQNLISIESLSVSRILHGPGVLNKYLDMLPRKINNF